MLLPLALFAFAVLVAVGFWRFSYDDAFITYRYAANLAATGSFEYNPGERVLGTTAPGWGLGLAALTAVSPLDVAAWGTLLSVGSLVALVLAYASMLRANEPLQRRALPLLFGVLVFTLRWNLEMLGAETLAVAALVPWGVLCAFRGRPRLGGLLLAAAAACRLDAGLAFGVLGIVLLWRDRRAAVRAAVAFGVPVVLYLGVVFATFGDVRPNTLGAKQSELTAALPPYSAQQWAWLERSLPAPGAAFGALALAMAAVGPALLRKRRLSEASPESLAAVTLGAWLLGHELAYRLVGVPFAPWYHVPTVNAVVALAAGGALAISRGLTRNLPARLRSAAAVGLAAVALFTIFRPGAFLIGSWRQPPDPRFVAFRSLGEHLDRGAPDGATVAALEIGVLGVFAPRQRVLDLGGLVSPEVLEARRAGRLTELVASRQPEYLVHSTLFPEVFDPLLAALAASYREELRLPDGRGQELILLRRSGNPPTPSASIPVGAPPPELDHGAVR
ncbi:MAG: hypothetical protein SF066_02715 [Thermoanaerobaculia bacterium]|nr:hypothetical protein [Thermoanaerobaculia bacterium]